MRVVLSLLVVLLATASLSNTSEAKGKPSGGGGGGAPRGSVMLLPSLVVPGPGDPDAFAYAVVSAGRNGVTFSMSGVQTTGFITTIAIYKGDAGQTGPMVVRLSPSPIGINQLMGTVPCDATVAHDIGRYPSSYFIQVNTSLYPGGAMRAQLQ